ncbi:serine/threonine-protein kinase [Streptomyces sp. NPDC002587]
MAAGQAMDEWTGCAVPTGDAQGGELVGKVLGGRYRVTAMVGRGGMGVVARAVDELLNREVAVKVLRAYTDASAAELADLRARMQREAQAAARIRHRGVVTVHDVTDDEGLPVIVMELVDGPSLDDVLAERGVLAPHEAAAIGAELMDVLDAAHRAGVLHRDVKPGNVLMEHGGRVVLTDFGIASMEAGEDDAMAKLTRSGEIVGSLDYLPPERAQGREPGPASDIWSLGMTLYATVEGTSPFRRTSVWSTLSAIVGEPLPEPRRAGALAPVLRALMAKEPESRPTADQARAMLRQVTAGSGVPAPPVPAVPRPHARPRARARQCPTRAHRPVRRRDAGSRTGRFRAAARVPAAAAVPAASARRPSAADRADAPRRNGRGTPAAAQPYRHRRGGSRRRTRRGWRRVRRDGRVRRKGRRPGTGGEARRRRGIGQRSAEHGRRVGWAGRAERLALGRLPGQALHHVRVEARHDSPGVGLLGGQAHAGAHGLRRLEPPRSRPGDLRLHVRRLPPGNRAL